MPPSAVLDTSSETADRPLAKTQRNLKNVERAFIAASRRADRDPDARLHSARRASKIHKQRTGKGLKISREIVLREEMYEEEEDDMPRSFRAFGVNAQSSTLSSDYPPNTDMAKIARQIEIERRFAEQFPTLQLSRRPGQAHGYPQHLDQAPRQLHARTASMSQYQHGTKSRNQPSPLAPPVSYPLPPTPQSRSISPNVLESSTTRPGSANSDPLPAPIPIHVPEGLAATRRWTIAGIPDDPSLQAPLFQFGMAPGPLPLPWELPQQTRPTDTIGMTEPCGEFRLAGGNQEPFTQDLYHMIPTSIHVQPVYPGSGEWQARDGFAPLLDTFMFEPAESSVATASVHGSPSRSPASPVVPTDGTGTTTPNVSWASWLNIDDDVEPQALGSINPLGSSGLQAKVVSAQV
ncbi:hypothetical protein BT67DRAFT_444688 [Trichocladium antarcticum]|uniref:Uncharacterized protein n=1 Tax=Trichocladium antarcticum TaxID=1450529 RepID=A0AAN6ZBK8_9PEZI|nr:hypothetical protein BT67DRAFT_444688 [Trichocladium antarcticum]